MSSLVAFVCRSARPSIAMLTLLCVEERKKELFPGAVASASKDAALARLLIAPCVARVASLEKSTSEVRLCGSELSDEVMSTTVFRFSEALAASVWNVSWLNWHAGLSALRFAAVWSVTFATALRTTGAEQCVSGVISGARGTLRLTRRHLHNGSGREAQGQEDVREHIASMCVYDGVGVGMNVRGLGGSDAKEEWTPGQLRNRHTLCMRFMRCTHAGAARSRSASCWGAAKAGSRRSDVSPVADACSKCSRRSDGDSSRRASGLELLTEENKLAFIGCESPRLTTPDMLPGLVPAKWPSA